MDVREKLMELIEKASYECDEGTRDLYDMREVADGIADFLIAHGVTVQEWISVDDKLPEDSGYYLVAYQNKHNGSTTIDIDMYVICNAGEWWSNEYKYKITHWMELPELPKGE